MTSVDFAFLQSLQELLCLYPNVTECGVAFDTFGTSVTMDSAV